MTSLVSTSQPASHHQSVLLALLVYFDAHWVTKAGNGKAIIDNERVAFLFLLGSNKSKNYKVTTFNDLLSLLILPPYFSHLSISNRVVNMQGKNRKKKKKKKKKKKRKRKKELTNFHVIHREKGLLEGS